MSKEVLRTALEGILKPGAHVTQAARTMGSIGLGLTIVWGIVVSVLRWVAPHIEWAAAYTGWTSLLVKGSVAILIVCVAAFAIGLILRSEGVGDGKAAPGLTGSDYVLEIRAVALTVGQRSQGRAWQGLRHRKGGWRTHDLISDPIPEDSLAKAFDPALGALPVEWPIPLLIWPPSDRDRSDFSPASVILSTSRYGLIFVEEHVVAEEHSDHIAEAVFSLFDKNDDMPMLLLASADGADYRRRSASDVVPNVSMMLFVRRDRVDRDVRPFVVDDVGSSVTPVSEIFRYFTQMDKRSPRKLDDQNWMDMSQWTPLVEQFIASKPKSPSIRRSNHVPAPWAARWFKPFDAVQSLGYLHRPRTVLLKVENAAIDIGDGLSEAWKSTSRLLPANAIPGRALLSGVLSERLAHKADHLVAEAPGGQKQVVSPGQAIGVANVIGELGRGEALATMAFAMHASTYEGDATAIVSTTSDSVSVAMVEGMGGV